MAYTGFKKLKEKLSKEPEVTNPEALAASIASKKYGKKELEKHTKNGTSMEHIKHKKPYGMS